VKCQNICHQETGIFNKTFQTKLSFENLYLNTKHLCTVLQYGYILSGVERYELMIAEVKHVSDLSSELIHHWFLQGRALNILTYCTSHQEQGISASKDLVTTYSTLQPTYTYSLRKLAEQYLDTM
jgi:hypothetical protein